MNSYFYLSTFKTLLILQAFLLRRSADLDQRCLEPMVVTMVHRWVFFILTLHIFFHFAYINIRIRPLLRINHTRTLVLELIFFFFQLLVFLVEGVNTISLSGTDTRPFCLGVRLVQQRTVQQVISFILSFLCDFLT